jgi:hypothetical protein
MRLAGAVFDDLAVVLGVGRTGVKDVNPAAFLGYLSHGNG